MTAIVSVYPSKIMHLKHKGEITYFGPSLAVTCIIIAGSATFVFWAGTVELYLFGTASETANQNKCFPKVMPLTLSSSIRMKTAVC